MKVSLIIPVKNEQSSILSLLETIKNQSLQPAEIIIVDGGSEDETLNLVREYQKEMNVRLIQVGDASPGKGRNIGVENAQNDLIAFTDAGIKLSKNWLEKLVAKLKADANTDVVYGNYAPIINNNFEKIATLTYVPAQRENAIRGKTIASYLMKKRAWDTVGGLPDLRAAEDLIFMEAVEEQGFRVSFAPEAMVYWQLRPDFSSTFQKFVLYSKHNVWAGRQWDWHHGVARQYLAVLPFTLLTIFHSWWWLSVVGLWLLARTAKRILLHRQEFGVNPLFHPLIFGGVALLILTIDCATFVGWGQGLLSKKR